MEKANQRRGYVDSDVDKRRYYARLDGGLFHIPRQQ